MLFANIRLGVTEALVNNRNTLSLKSLKSRCEAFSLLQLKGLLAEKRRNTVIPLRKKDSVKFEIVSISSTQKVP